MGIWRCAICDFPAREVVDGVIVPVGADVIVEVIDTRRFFHLHRFSVAIREICVRIMFSCPFLCAFKKNMYICRGKTKY